MSEDQKEMKHENSERVPQIVAASDNEVKQEVDGAAKADPTDSNPSTDSITAQDYISSQLELEREAKEIMPYDPNVCTYTIGAIRQQIYACLTCLNKTGQVSGICYSCSIQCHSDHDLVELFTKRNFTCDCGTTRMNHPCYLRSKITDDIPSSSNSYNQNFKGHFCHCKQLYNPIEEKSNMLQCIFGEVCQEDWYHDYCIMGLSHYDPPKSKDDGINKLDQLGEPEIDAETQNEKNQEESKDTFEDYDDEEEEPVLDGFPSLDDFDCYICWKCINKYRGFFDNIKENNDIVFTTVQRIESEDLQQRNSIILQNHDSNGLISKKRKIDYDYSIFLKDNYEENFKNLYNTSQNPTIKEFLDEFNFLMNDDPIYEPPNDDEINEEGDDDNSSIYDLGAKAINSLPREQAIQGAQAFQDIKSKLKDFLAPFAQEGKIVGKGDVEKFFQEMKR